MRIYIASFLFTVITLLLCFLLTGCPSRGDVPSLTDTETQTDSSPNTTVETEEATDTEPVTEVKETVTEPLVEDFSTRLPYTLKVTRTDLLVLNGAGYDNGYVNLLQPGIYTIVEEKSDGEGNLWGKLKSGIGWIDITKAYTENKDPLPISVGLADTALLGSQNYHEFIASGGAQAQKLVFYAREALTNVMFFSLDFIDNTYTVSEQLYTLPSLSPEKPLIAQVSFPGDLTTYGISFTDARGKTRNFAVSVSGRNGAVVINEVSVLYNY